jgi:murein DD-endopeptidase MepM/ murein hydrolase activator NlpD
MKRALQGTLEISILIAIMAACSGGQGSEHGPDAGGPGDDSFSEIGTAGGNAVLSGVASVTFPPGSFPSSRPVRLEQTSEAAAASAFEDSAALFRPQGRLTYEVHIETGNAPPALPVLARLNLPQTLTIPAGHGIEVFARFREQSELDAYDAFELVPSTFDAAARMVTVSLSPDAFTDKRRADGAFEAVVTLAPTPSPSVSAHAPVRANGLRNGGKLVPPLESLSVASPFDPKRVNGVIQGTAYPPGHWGVDFVAPSNTRIFAVADSTVERAYFSDTYGQCILLQVPGIGTVRYAHLARSAVKTGDKVLAGQEIGLTDNSGTATTGPHLHFELAPDGHISNDKSKVDPAPAIQAAKLNWKLESTATVDIAAVVAGGAGEAHRRLHAEVDLVLDKTDEFGMSLRLVSGTLQVEATEKIQGPEGIVCTAVSQSTTHTITPGNTEGTFELARDFMSQPSIRYLYNSLYATTISMDYSMICPNGGTAFSVPDFKAEWIFVPTGGSYPLDPLGDSASDSFQQQMTPVAGLTLTANWNWTLTKDY